jgi:hypothetical protein
MQVHGQLRSLVGEPGTVAVERHTPRRVATAPVVEELVPGHLTAECATELDGGPACPACLAYRLRGYTLPGRPS